MTSSSNFSLMKVLSNSPPPTSHIFLPFLLFKSVKNEMIFSCIKVPSLNPPCSFLFVRCKDYINHSSLLSGLSETRQGPVTVHISDHSISDWLKSAFGLEGGRGNLIDLEPQLLPILFRKSGSFLHGTFVPGFYICHNFGQHGLKHG